MEGYLVISLEKDEMSNQPKNGRMVGIRDGAVYFDKKEDAVDFVKSLSSTLYERVIVEVSKVYR